MSDTGTIDTSTAPLESVSTPVSVSSPEIGEGATISDTITDDLLSDDNLDIEEVDAVGSEDGDSDDFTTAPQPAPGTPVAPVAPVETAPAAPVAPTAPVEPVAPVAPVVTPDPSQPQSVAPQTLEEARAVLRENYTRARTEMEGALASTHYKLDDATVAALEAGDTAGLAQMIPQIAAKVHMDAMTSAVAHVMQYMPNMLGNLMEAREVETKAQNDFFTAWPQLKMETHGAVIQRLGLAYRQANPSASAADFTRDVGAQAVVALKLALQPGGTAPVAPAAPAAFRPASSGGSGGSAPAPSGTINPFEALALSADEGDLD